MNFLLKLTMALALMSPLAAFAQDNNAVRIQFDRPWARAIMMSRPAAGFVTVHNLTDKADRIVAARSAMADRVELHNHIMDGGVMKMRPVDAIDVPAGGQVALKPGGLHLMIFGLKHLPKKGEVMPITLVFEQAGPVDVDFVVGEGAAGQDHGKEN